MKIFEEYRYRWAVCNAVKKALAGMTIEREKTGLRFTGFTNGVPTEIELAFYSFNSSYSLSFGNKEVEIPELHPLRFAIQAIADKIRSEEKDRLDQERKNLYEAIIGR